MYNNVTIVIPTFNVDLNFPGSCIEFLNEDFTLQRILSDLSEYSKSRSLKIHEGGAPLIPKKYLERFW